MTVSKEDLLEIKRMNEERRKMNEKRKKLSREESYNRKWNWDDNKPKKNKVKNDENSSKDNSNKINNLKPWNKERKYIVPLSWPDEDLPPSPFDEEGNPIDPVAYMVKVTWKAYGNTKNYTSKRWKIDENDSIHRIKSFDLNSIEDLHKICDREWDYVHELQRILFSYFAIDIENTRIALSKIDDKDWEILKLFEEELWNAMGWWLDFFHRWEILAVGNDFEHIIDTVVWLHKWLEKVKEQINKKIKNPEDKLPMVYPFYNWIHGHSPRNKNKE